MSTSLSERLLGSEYVPLATHEKGADIEENPRRISRSHSFLSILFGLLTASVLLNGYLIYTREYDGRMRLNPFPQLIYCEQLFSL